MKSFNRQIIIYCLVGLVLFGAIVYTFYELSRLTKIINQQKRNLFSLEQDLLALDNLLEVKKNYSSQLNTIVDSLPASYQQVADYTQELEQLSAKFNQVLDTQIDKEAKPETTGLLSLQYVIKTKGGFETFNQLLSSLSLLPYHTKVDSIKLNNESNEASTQTSYRIYLLDKTPISNQGIPKLDINLINRLAIELAENRLKGGE